MFLKLHHSSIQLQLLYLGQWYDETADLGGAKIFDDQAQCGDACLRLHELMERESRLQIGSVFLFVEIKTDAGGGLAKDFAGFVLFDGDDLDGSLEHSSGTREPEIVNIHRAKETQAVRQWLLDSNYFDLN
ncbi:MAG: hypothetical protein ACRD3Q_14470, partial [Terriglobales bacterium]